MSDILVPAMGESITEGTISKWLVKEGDSVGQGDVLLELETDKVNLEISAEEAGVVQKILRQEGETVVIGEAVGLIGSGSGSGNAEQSGAGEAAATQAPEAPSVATLPASTAGGGTSAVEQAAQPIASNGDGNGQTASPSARKLARERGIDLEQVQGKDPLGRVFQEDVKTHANSADASRAASPAPATPR
ncbi:biotin/lipoyl-binding protein, partial [Paenibacillus sp. 28ISP30-2]|nr:biotin/lipoyl-binding protein [Paenibacillus sp. 28ISP30-2]